MKRVIYCFFALLLCPALICGCTHEPPKRSTWLDYPFSAEIHGELNEKEFTATIVGEGQGKAICITYLAPESLSDLSISMPIDTIQAAEVEAGGAVRITRKSLTLTQSVGAVEGLLLPITTLVELAGSQAQIQSIQKSQNGYAFGFADGAILTTDENGTPTSLSSQDVTFKVVWWEQELGKKE